MVDEIQILTSVVTIAVGALVSFLVAAWYGPRAVLRETVKHNHSEKLVSNVLAPWRQDPFKYCRMGVAFRGREEGDFSVHLGEGGGVILGREHKSTLGGMSLDVNERDPIDPPLEYINELESHLESAYPGFLTLWHEAQSMCSALNRDIHNFLEGIGKELYLGPETKKEAFRNWNGAGNPPTTYFLIEDVIFQVWLELERIIHGKTDRPSSLPPISSRSVPSDMILGVNFTVYELQLDSTQPALVRTMNKDACEEIRASIHHLAGSVSNASDVKEFESRMQEVNGILRRFGNLLQEVKAQVDLGKNLKGSCDKCPVTSISLRLRNASRNEVSL
jgi:hypothetical protein